MRLLPAQLRLLTLRSNQSTGDLGRTLGVGSSPFVEERTKRGQCWNPRALFAIGTAFPRELETFYVESWAISEAGARQQMSRCIRGLVVACEKGASSPWNQENP